MPPHPANQSQHTPRCRSPGGTSSELVHLSDWFATLSHLAGVDEPDDGPLVPPVDSQNLWPRWAALAATLAEGGAVPLPAPRTLALSSQAIIEMRHLRLADGPGVRAYKLIASGQCDCVGCRPCLPCNVSGGCLFEVLSDPVEAHDLSSTLPGVRQELRRKLAAAARGAWHDRSAVNLECWENPRADPDYWLEYALQHGSVMQPWLLAGATAQKKRGARRLTE
eukprot:407680-Prymnesium_polylepis.1